MWRRTNARNVGNTGIQKGRAKAKVTLAASLMQCKRKCTSNATSIRPSHLSFASIFRIHRSHAFVAIRIYLAHTANAMHAISGWNPVKPKWIPGQAATVGIDTLSNNNI